MHTGFFSLLTASVLCVRAAAPQLEKTAPLTMPGDISAEMVAGIDRFLDRQTERAAAERAGFWKREFASREAFERSIENNRKRLKYLLGILEEPASFDALEVISSTVQPEILAETAGFKVRAVRWPALNGVHGEGLWIQPKSRSKGTVIALPDADQTPEMLAGLEMGIPAQAQFARRFAEMGFEVFVPVLVNRSDAFSGNEELGRFTNQPHREWIYRQGYEVGRGVIGYEVQKVLALVDWLQRRGDESIRAAGYGEGGLIALYAAALDPRIRGTLVSGYFGPREHLWEEPIYRNVFSLLREFGDAEIASMVAPRTLVIEYSEGPSVSGPPAVRQGRGGAAPGRLWTFERYQVEQEFNRLIHFFPPAFNTDFHFVFGNEGAPVLAGSDEAITILTGVKPGESAALSSSGAPWSEERQKRQVNEIVQHIQHQLVVGERQRDENFWRPLSKTKAAEWQTERTVWRDKFRDEVIGSFGPPQKEMNPRSRLTYENEKWAGYEVMLDVWPDVFAWGILLIPNDLKPGEKRPVVVCQHGLEGLPQDTIEGPGSRGYGPYKAFAARLAEQGFITFAPHNPYRGQDKFRVLQRKSNPLGRTLFSTIIGQHEQLLNWLQALPFVDPQRIGFYGLSYGGKSAMRIPSIVDRYALSICSADFNDWVKKCATIHSPYSYLYTIEYDMPEFALGPRFNYAEMAALIAPRPFMVERGHGDGVAPDEWVAYEFAKVRRFYDQLGIGDRTEIEFFNGPHTINGDGTFRFLRRHLNWRAVE